MRSIALLGLLVSVTAPAFAAAESASASVIVSATFSTRTSLTVSTKLLQFAVVEPGVPTTASVEFSARARTHAESEVVLAVETVRSVTTTRSAKATSRPASMDAILFDGEGEGATAGILGSGSPAVAGRWTGSGARAGRLIFTLYAADAGSYSVPVRFVLTAP